MPVGRRYQPGGIPLSSSTGDADRVRRHARLPARATRCERIHWRSWARRGEPGREGVPGGVLLPDRDRPRHLPAAPARRRDGSTSFEAAISVVASIADLFSRSEYIVDILAAGPDVYEVSAGRSLAYLENILDVLACLESVPRRAVPDDRPAPVREARADHHRRRGAPGLGRSERTFLRRVAALGTAVRAIVVHDGPTTRPGKVSARSSARSTS